VRDGAPNDELDAVYEDRLVHRREFAAVVGVGIRSGIGSIEQFPFAKNARLEIKPVCHTART
jgi:hypothetical protein